MSDYLVLRKSDTCYAKIHLFGATVTSWIYNGIEQLFLSSSSKMDGSKAIRGGIPIVFPNFGPWSLGPQHGFARISSWNVEKSPTKMENGNVVAILQLSDNEETRKLWNFQFNLLYEVVLSDKSMQTQLKITNVGMESFDFTTLLHTYIKVSDIKQTTITGFKDCFFIDKIEGTENNNEERNLVTINRLVDRVYKAAGSNRGHKVSSPGSCLTIEKTNMPDTVLWNPWKEKAAALSDFDDEGYLNMICVEAGYVSERKLLSPNEVFICAQTLTVEQ